MTPGFVRNIELAGAGLMGVAFLIGFFSLYIIKRYHLLYIATLLYATEVHHAAGIIGFRWFEDMIELLGEEYKKMKKLVGRNLFGLEVGVVNMGIFGTAY